MNIKLRPVRDILVFSFKLRKHEGLEADSAPVNRQLCETHSVAPNIYFSPLDAMQ